MQHRIGIVLSGGGMRGAAHVGVLEALEKNGIRPDCIAGTSAGALVGALYGAGRSSSEMVEFFERTNPVRLSRLTFRKPGLVDIEKYRRVLSEYLPDDAFDALRIQLFVTATDMMRARLEIFNHGPLISPLLASSAIPIVFTPMKFDGRLFSDGGILNNFPIEPLKVLCDSILGVYASPLRTPRDGELESTLSVSQRAFEVAMFLNSSPKFRECDMLLSPPELSEYGVFTKQAKEVYEIGFRATIERMDAIVARLEAKEAL